MPRDPRSLLPLKPLVFHLLVALLDGDRHGWSLLRATEAQPDLGRVMPAQLYRQMASMLDEGLVTEHDAPASGAKVDADAPTGGAKPRRFFRLTRFGREVARAEAQRLTSAVADARVKSLLSRTRS